MSSPTQWQLKSLTRSIGTSWDDERTITLWKVTNEELRVSCEFHDKAEAQRLLDALADHSQLRTISNGTITQVVFGMEAVAAPCAIDGECRYPLDAYISVEDREKALEKAEEAGYDYMRMGSADLPAPQVRTLRENVQRAMKEARTLLKLDNTSVAQ